MCKSSINFYNLYKSHSCVIKHCSTRLAAIDSIKTNELHVFSANLKVSLMLSTSLFATVISSTITNFTANLYFKKLRTFVRHCRNYKPTKTIPFRIKKHVVKLLMLTTSYWTCQRILLKNDIFKLKSLHFSG